MGFDRALIFNKFLSTNYVLCVLCRRLRRAEMIYGGVLMAFEQQSEKGSRAIEH